MTVHKQEHGDRTEYDLVDSRDDALVRVTHDSLDRSLPIGIGAAVYDPWGEKIQGEVQWETNWLTLDQARDLLGLLQQVVADVSADQFAD